MLIYQRFLSYIFLSFSDFNQSSGTTSHRHDTIQDDDPVMQSSTLVIVKRNKLGDPQNSMHNIEESNHSREPPITSSNIIRQPITSGGTYIQTKNVSAQPIMPSYTSQPMKSDKLRAPKMNDLHTSAVRLDELKKSSARLENLEIDGHCFNSAMLTKHNVDLYTQTLEEKYKKFKSMGSNTVIRDPSEKNDIAVISTFENHRKPLTAPEAQYYLHFGQMTNEDLVDSEVEDVLALSTKSLALSKDLSHSMDSLRMLPAITSGKCENLVVDSRTESKNKHQVQLYYVMEKKKRLRNALAEKQTAAPRELREKREKSQSLDCLQPQKIGTCELFCAGTQFSMESQRIDGTSNCKTNKT